MPDAAASSAEVTLGFARTMADEILPNGVVKISNTWTNSLFHFTASKNS